MSAMITAVVGSAVIGAGASIYAGNKASSAAKSAAKTQAASQTEALNYLKEVEALPRELREGALKKLGGLYGLEGGEGNQADLIKMAEESPLYKSLMGSKMAGEESILRNQTMTGGLRSGNTQDALYRYNTEYDASALLESFNEQKAGLAGLSGLPSYATEIAGITTGVGQTQAAGITAAATADQAKYAQLTKIGIDLISQLPALAGKTGTSYSDKRLKTNIVVLEIKNKLSWCKWTWNNAANKLGLFGESAGYIANEVAEVFPNAVSIKNGFLAIDYGRLEALNG